MSKIEMKVLTAPGCVHCHEFLQFWNTESVLWGNITMREVDVLSSEGQHLVSTYKIFALPGIVIGETVVSSGEPNIAKIRSLLAKLSM